MKGAQNGYLQRSHQSDYGTDGRRYHPLEKTLDFLERTQANELMVVSNLFHHHDRLRSYQLFGEIMNEINAGK